MKLIVEKNAEKILNMIINKQQQNYLIDKYFWILIISNKYIKALQNFSQKEGYGVESIGIVFQDSIDP